MLLPLMSLLIPAPKPLLQVSEARSGSRQSPARDLLAPVRIERIHAPADRSRPISQTTPSNAQVSAGAQVSVAIPASPGMIVPAETTPSVSASHVASGALVRFVPCLAALWLLGVLLVLGRLGIGFAHVRRIARCSDATLPEALQTQLKAILSETGFTRPLTIVQSSRQQPVSVPMTWGVRPATLLLPADAGEWPADQLRMVLLHELAHVRRCDWLTQMFGQVVCALYWFHPLVWILYRHTQIEAERACDDAVLLTGVRAKEYANHLLDVVKAMQAGKEAPSAAVAMARPTQVRYRLQSILNAQRSRNPATHSVRTLVLMVTALLLCTASWFRPLAWAGAHRQAGDPKQVPSGPIVTLPNGVSVELAAVGSDPIGRGDDWWLPNGKPLLEAPKAKHVGSFTREGFGVQYLRRAFFLRLQTQPKAQLSIAGYVVDPTGHLQKIGYQYGRTTRLNLAATSTSEMGGSVVLGFPPTETACTYRFGISTAPWETIATTRFSLHPTPGSLTFPTKTMGDQVLLSFEDPHLEYRDAQGRGHLDSLLGDHAPLGDVARRLIALDKDGNEIARLEDYPYVYLQTLDEKWSRMVEIRLQTRPYQWAEFKDIVLTHPSVLPPAISSPPALPAFRHTFASGITLTIPAITEKRVEGGLWWKPNGQKLAGPLKEYAQTVTFQSWPDAKRPRLLLVQLESPRAFSYQSTFRFTPSIPDGWENVLAKVEYSIGKGKTFTQLGGDFPPNRQSTTLRYGVAAGPWKTAASIMMPQDVRQPYVVDHNHGDLRINLPDDPKAGELPRLKYTTTAGELHDLPFIIRDTSYLKDVSRRFVAVDTAGRVFTLPFESATHMSVDSAGNYIPLDPANAGKTHLPISAYEHRGIGLVNLSFGNKAWILGCPPVDLTKIREFRLEICPYEWAEFPNIALQPAQGDAHR